MALITTLEEYREERYRALEISLLEETSRRMGREFERLRGLCLGEWQRMLADALAVQGEAHIPCAYMSISFLNTSLLDGKPLLQVDFYNGDWVYGEPWARGRMAADFLFHGWDAFCVKALDDSFYVRNKLRRTAIKSLFWETAEKLAYLFACFAKYFMKELSELPAFQTLEKEPVMYVTCGTYLDWQERIYGILPEIDLTDPPDNEETAFREFHGKSYREKAFQNLDLRHCRFYDCVFRSSVLSRTDLSDAYFARCRFYDTDFVQLSVAGCAWEECTLTFCRFQASGTRSEGDEYFADAEMVRSKILGVQAIGCDFSHFRLKDCEVADAILEDVRVEHSDWGEFLAEVKTGG